MTATLHILYKISCFVFVINNISTYCAYMLKIHLNWYVSIYGKGVQKSNTMIWDLSPATMFNPHFSKTGVRFERIVNDKLGFSFFFFFIYVQNKFEEHPLCSISLCGVTLTKPKFTHFNTK